MAPVGTLWTVDYQAKGKAVSCGSRFYPGIPVDLSSRGQIKAAAAYAGLEIALPASYEHYVDNKKPEFLAKFPHGKVPAFESADGFKVVEGAAIARYSESSYRLSNRSQSWERGGVIVTRYQISNIRFYFEF